MLVLCQVQPNFSNMHSVVTNAFDMHIYIYNTYADNIDGVCGFVMVLAQCNNLPNRKL